MTNHDETLRERIEALFEWTDFSGNIGGHFLVLKENSEKEYALSVVEKLIESESIARSKHDRLELLESFVSASEQLSNDGAEYGEHCKALWKLFQTTKAAIQAEGE